MSSNIGKLAQDLQQILDNKNRRKTSPYDTSAEVIRVDSDTLWVHIPGGVDETPIKKTVDAHVGDSVQVHIENGGAWAVGNATRPPTDDAKATVAVTMATTADLKAADAKVAATEAINTAQAVQSEIEDVQTDIEIARGEISEINSDITELQSDVSTAQGNITTIQGNITTLQSNVSTAQGDISTIQGNITSINGQISSINSDIDGIEGDVSALSGRVSTAEGKVTTLEGQVSTAQTNIQNLQTRIGEAETDISAVEGDIDALETRVAYAEDDIDDTLKGLALAQDVIGAVNWLTAHSTVTTDTTPVSGTTYYIKNQDNTFTIVTDTTGKNPAQEGWYVMDEAVSNYVATHLALTDSGLYVAADDSDWKVLIADDGVYIIDASSGINKMVASYSDTVTIGENRTGKTRTEIDSSGMHVYRNASGTDTLVAHLGYGEGSSATQMGKEDAPYFTFGKRRDYGGGPYNPNDTYSIGDVCNYGGQRYVCIKDITTPEAWNTDHWHLEIGAYSVAEGYDVDACGHGAHVEGRFNHALGHDSHAEGSCTWAIGMVSHAEGSNSIAYGDSSHAEGYNTEARGSQSHAGGNGTIANGASQTVIGEFNETENTRPSYRGNYAFIIGNGTDDDNRSNALTVAWNGNVVASGSITDGSGNVLSNKVDSSVLSAVATSGSYADLSGKPTNVSDFTNDAGYISSYTETDPTVPSWAKAATKPSYSASEINGLLDFFYPVGSYYETSDSTFDPNVAWGGTWVQETEGLVHIGAGSNYTLGSTGGSKDAIIPYHNHGTTITQPTFTIPNHKHVSYNYVSSALASGSVGARIYTPGGSNGTEMQTPSGGGGGACTRTTNVAVTVNYAGTSGNATNANMQPYIVVNRWHRTA